MAPPFSDPRARRAHDRFTKRMGRPPTQAELSAEIERGGRIEAAAPPTLLDLERQAAQGRMAEINAERLARDGARSGPPPVMFGEANPPTDEGITRALSAGQPVVIARTLLADSGVGGNLVGESGRHTPSMPDAQGFMAAGVPVVPAMVGPGIGGGSALAARSDQDAFDWRIDVTADNVGWGSPAENTAQAATTPAVADLTVPPVYASVRVPVSNRLFRQGDNIVDYIEQASRAAMAMRLDLAVADAIDAETAVSATSAGSSSENGGNPSLAQVAEVLSDHAGANPQAVMGPRLEQVLRTTAVSSGDRMMLSGDRLLGVVSHRAAALEPRYASTVGTPTAYAGGDAAASGDYLEFEATDGTRTLYKATASISSLPADPTSNANLRTLAKISYTFSISGRGCSSTPRGMRHA